jgi:hypothetical protein
METRTSRRRIDAEEEEVEDEQDRKEADASPKWWGRHRRTAGG